MMMMMMMMMVRMRMMMMVMMVMCCWSLGSGAARGEPQAPHEDTLDFGFVPAVVYETHAHYEPGAVDVLFHVVHAFLHTVQPNPFPADLIVRMLQQNMNGIKPEELQKPENIVLTLQAIYYEIGFIVLAALGVVFVLLMPLVGLFFCLCRCCENCGGEMHQRHRKNADCQRGFYTVSLITSSVFIAVGVLVAYTGSHNITSQIKSTKRLVSSNIKDLKSLASYTPAQIEYLTAQYTTAKNKVLSNLDNIGPLLGGQIHKQLDRDVMPALDNVLRMAAAMRDTKEALENVSTSLETLQEATTKLRRSLQSERSSLSNTLHDPACSSGNATHTCDNIRAALNRLAVSANFNGLPDVSPQLANLETVMETDLSYIVQKGYSAFNDTSRIVSEQTQDFVNKVKALLDKSGAEIVAFTNTFPVEPALENFTRFLTEAEKDIEALYPQIDQFDFYRWIGCVVLCCMVVLILAFNLLGLMCGMCGHDKNTTPTTRGCLSNTGGNLLMAGVGFSFIFSWVLMGVVVTTFVTGGNVEKLVCEPLANRQLFMIIDAPYVVHPGKKNFLPGMLFQNHNIDLTIGSLYSDCYENNGIYSALQLENQFHFIQFVNRTVNNHNLAEIFEGVMVDLEGIILLEEEGKDNLINFANAGLGDINYEAYLSEVNKGVTVVDLLSFANELEAEADHLPRGALGNALKGHASSIRQIHKEQVVPMEQAMKFVRARSSLSQSIRLLQTTVEELPTKVTNVLSAIDAAEYLIANNASHVVKKETDKYTKNLMGYLKQYVNWVQLSLTMEVAQCKPISNIIDSLEIVGCSFIVDSVNTFWFGLGGCCLFLIPSIIMSVKLAKFYRRMDTEDVFEDKQWWKLKAQNFRKTEIEETSHKQ
ncbi:prominin 1 b isoform X3 [Pangasianodon hypophthalmus]|uniref:prominin 1 b isoform X3 n=1 Tax=Pangasianodon hypophthalmus TaxID=310915 RepID=UPI002307654B|nr:prominin 1 b isoform X3 [Pangasianodon hypophthalmus]